MCVILTFESCGSLFLVPARLTGATRLIEVFSADEMAADMGALMSVKA